MINFLDEKLKTKLFNFLGLTKKIVLKNNYMIIKVFNLKGVKNIEKFIEEKLEGHLGDTEELLIHYEILKINKEKKIIVYILKEDRELEFLLRENLKVKLKTVQMEKGESFKKKFKMKSGVIILKEKDVFYSMSFAEGILVSYDETNFLEDINIIYHKEFLEKILSKEVNKIYISKEILKENKKEIEEFNLTFLGV